MTDGALLVWFVLAAASLVFVIRDPLGNALTSWVQRIGRVPVVAYMGVGDLVLCLRACRRPSPGAHDAYARASWKQGVNSEMD